jgi:hypothetical protein
LTQEGTVRLYRCILDGTYFDNKEVALIHLRVYHDFKGQEDLLLREVDFPSGQVLVMPGQPG